MPPCLGAFMLPFTPSHRRRCFSPSIASSTVQFPFEIHDSRYHTQYILRTPGWHTDPLRRLNWYQGVYHFKPTRAASVLSGALLSLPCTSPLLPVAFRSPLHPLDCSCPSPRPYLQLPCPLLHDLFSTFFVQLTCPMSSSSSTFIVSSHYALCLLPSFYSVLRPAGCRRSLFYEDAEDFVALDVDRKKSRPISGSTSP